MAMAACPARASRKSSHSRSGSRTAAIEDLQDALDLSLGHQRDGVVGHEPLLREQGGADEGLASPGPGRRCAAGGVRGRLARRHSASNRTRVCRMAVVRKPLPAAYSSVLGPRVVEEDVGGIDLELDEDLVQADIQGEAQVEARGDGPCRSAATPRAAPGGGGAERSGSGSPAPPACVP